MIINANSSSVLHIGRVGENNATKVVFDISKWVEEYGKGEVTLVIEQNEVISLIGTTDPALQIEGNKVIWLVSDAFTKMEDRGKCELYYSIDNVKVKSVLFDIVVTKSLDGYEEVAPTPYDGWINQLLDAAGEVSGAVEYAERAEAAAKQAEESVTKIEEIKKDVDEVAAEVVINANKASEAEKNATISAGNAENAAKAIQEQITSVENIATRAENAAKAIQEQIPSINQNVIDAAAAAQEATEALNEIKGLEEPITQKAQEAIDTVNEFSETVDDAEAWAVGQRNGVDVLSTDKTYQNNSKYYSQEAKKYRDEAQAIVGGEFASETYVNNAVDNHNKSLDAHPDIRELVNKAGSAEYVINQNNKEEKYYFWFGSQEEYEAIITKDPFTLYIVDNSLTEEEKRILEEHLNDFENPHRVTAEQIGAAEKSHTHTKADISDFSHLHEISDVNGLEEALAKAGNEGGASADAVQDALDKHIADENNPHGVTASQIGAAPSSHTHTKSQITDFPTSMPASDVSAWAKAENKPEYTYTEVGAAPASHKHSKTDITDFPTTMAPSSHKHSKSDITDFPTSMPASDVYSWAKAVSKPTYTASEVGAVPTSRTVNGKALSANISLTASDVGAAASSHNQSASTITSGTLPVARGGTGVTSLDALKTALGISSSTSITPTYGISSTTCHDYGDSSGPQSATAAWKTGSSTWTTYTVPAGAKNVIFIISSITGRNHTYNTITLNINKNGSVVYTANVNTADANYFTYTPFLFSTAATVGDKFTVTGSIEYRNNKTSYLCFGEILIIAC